MSINKLRNIAIPITLTVLVACGEMSFYRQVIFENSNSFTDICMKDASENIKNLNKFKSDSSYDLTIKYYVFDRGSAQVAVTQSKKLPNIVRASFGYTEAGPINKKRLHDSEQLLTEVSEAVKVHCKLKVVKE